MKDISSVFEETRDPKDTAFSVIIDENLFKQLLSTSTVGYAIPSFKQEYGENRNIDIVGSLSHEFISDKIDNVQPSGIQMDKNGNVKFTINIGS